MTLEVTGADVNFEHLTTAPFLTALDDIIHKNAIALDYILEQVR
jgi:hypothetical protein